MRAHSIHYVDDSDAGISRRASGKGFAFYNASGRLIRDKAEKARIKALVIPPAWSDVWISPDPRGHIQATGRDTRGRKQYIYHRDFRVWRESAKFEHVVDFALALPDLRRRVEEDLAGRKLDEKLVLATAVRVLEQTLMRVGNVAYLMQNQTYGLTTLKEKHVRHNGVREVRFTFRSKGGKQFRAKLSDRRIAAVLRRMEDLPGQHLFQFLDEEGEVRRIASDDVNAYIRDATGGDFSAKDFRTWSATVLAALALLGQEPAASDRATRANMRRAIEKVAQRLCNTVTICRKSYIHPEILEGYADGSLTEMLRSSIEGKAEEARSELSHEEEAVLTYLRWRLDERAGKAKAA